MNHRRWINIMILSLIATFLTTAAGTHFGTINLLTEARIAQTQGKDSSSQDLSEQTERGRQSSAPQTIYATTKIPEGVKLWHAAGFTGTGVKVGILDSNFGGLLTEMNDEQLAQIQGYCFTEDSDDDDEELDTVTDSLQPCENLAPGGKGDDKHGTYVLKALMLVAPDAQFYISNPPDANEARRAVMWMQGKAVEVINSSRGYEWDGPGNGTATRNRPTEHPIIETTNLAIAGGALWVNSAGNEKTSTWFKRNPSFEGSFLNMQGDTTPADTCNQVELKDDKTYRFIMRWKDNWPTSETDQGPNTDLVLQVTDPDDDELTPVDGTRDNTQDGDSDQYPRERMNFRPDQDGTHCVKVKLKSGSAPAWIQFQERFQDKELEHRPTMGEGSISNPAESSNAGLLAVGATWLVGTGTVVPLEYATAYGPPPEPGPPNERIKPDLMADGLLITRLTSQDGTSFAASKVAGLAALIRQAMRHLPEMDEPKEIADYLRNQAVRPTGASVNQWGYGSARLPAATAPTSISFTLRGDLEGLVVIYPRGGEWTNIQTKSLVRVWRNHSLIGPPTLHREEYIRQNARLHITLPTGYSYFVTAHTCGQDATNIDGCGPSAQSADLEIPLLLDTPTDFRGLARITSIRVLWEAVSRAETYEIKQGGSTDTVTTELTDHIFQNLTPGETYTFRVRAVARKWMSEWTEPLTVTLPAPKPPAPSPTTSGLSGGRVQITWTGIDNADTYKVRQCDRQAGQWKIHPYTEAGQDNPFTIQTESTTSASISGLTDGVTYTFKVGSVNDAGTRWSEPTDATAGSTTPATPEQSPGGQLCPSEENGPSMLAYTLSGTELTLTWTASTYTDTISQRVRRRQQGEDWTDFNIGTGITTWTDTSAVSGTKYIYRVQAPGPSTGDNGRMSNRQVVTIP